MYLSLRRDILLTNNYRVDEGASSVKRWEVALKRNRRIRYLRRFRYESTAPVTTGGPAGWMRAISFGVTSCKSAEALLSTGGKMKSNAISRSRSRTRVVVYAGLLIAISAVLKLVFEVYIPLGGFPSLRINLTAIPTILSGIILGPGIGFLVGIITDLLCYVIKPGGPWFIGFTISSGLTGLIPGLFWMLFKKYDFRHIKWFNTCFIVIALAILMVTGLFSFQDGQIYYSGEVLNPFMLVLFAALLFLFAAYPFIAERFMKKSEAQDTENLLVIVTFEQIVNSIILNTWFLSMLYGQAWMILLPARVITNIFLIPIYTIVLSGLLRVIRQNT